jgi:hypothetical protein
MAEPSPLQKFMGGLLMAVGGMIATLCGACTLYFAVISFFQRGGEFAGPGMLVLILPVGGIPTLIGALLAWQGWRLYRPTRRVRPETLAVFSDDKPPDA